MKRVRGGSGLGDALYVRVVAEHLARQGEDVIACSDQPDAFLGAPVTVQQFRRDNIDVLAHYTQGKAMAGTNQWQDVCRSAGIPEIPLAIDWTVRNQALVDTIRARAEGRPIVLVHGGRAPMARTDGFGNELLPLKPAFDLVLDQLADCFLVRIGKGANVYDLRANADLGDSTSVSDLFDLAATCDAMVAQCSFVVPLAECFDKPLLAVWSTRGLTASHIYVRQITPQKVLSKATSRFVMDEWEIGEIVEAARAFRQF